MLLTEQITVSSSKFPSSSYFKLSKSPLASRDLEITSQTSALSSTSFTTSSAFASLHSRISSFTKKMDSEGLGSTLKTLYWSLLLILVVVTIAAVIKFKVVENHLFIYSNQVFYFLQVVVNTAC